MWQRKDFAEALLMRLEPLRRVWAVARASMEMEQLRPKFAGRSADELAFLPAVVEIIETPASPAGRTTSIVIMAAIVVGLIWATFGRVDIHATAQGRIITIGKTKAVSPPESASVAAIHVKDGDHVTEGQVLLELDPTNPQADSEKLEREQLEYVVTAARLRALVAGHEKIELPADIGIPADILAVHQAELHQALADHQSTVGALRRELEQKEAKARGAQSEVERLVQTIPVVEQRAKAKETAANEGFGSRDEYLAIEQDLIDRKQHMETARFELREAEADIGNVKERLTEVEAKFHADALTQLADVGQKAASAGHDLVKSQQRSRLYRLTSPVDGVVQQMTVHAPGAMVSQGQPVLLVVPEGEGIAVEAALQNKDVGFVLPGQHVEIKVESFPFTRYGTISGEVVNVSGDAVQNGDSDPVQRRASGSGGGSSPSTENQGAIYAVRIRLLADDIHADGRDVPLTPGMGVTAEIKVGRRRVIDYVLDPMLRYRDESLRER